MSLDFEEMDELVGSVRFQVNEELRDLIDKLRESEQEVVEWVAEAPPVPAVIAEKVSKLPKGMTVKQQLEQITKACESYIRKVDRKGDRIDLETIWDAPDEWKGFSEEEQQVLTLNLWASADLIIPDRAIAAIFGMDGLDDPVVGKRVPARR